MECTALYVCQRKRTENRVGSSTFQKAVTSRFILAFALSSLPLSPSSTTSHHQRFSVLKIILLSSFPLPEPLIAVPNHPLSIWPLSQYNRIHSSWGVASLPRLMYPPWMVPTSLMKYVLFLSAHLDRPVSSLEQNGKTGETVQHWTWQSVQRQCRVKGGRFITVPVHLSTREQCNTQAHYHQILRLFFNSRLLLRHGWGLSWESRNGRRLIRRA